MHTVSELMTRDPVSVRERDTAAAASELMQARAIRHLPVTRRKKVVGLVTASDLKACGEARVRDVMTGEVATVVPESELRSAIELMMRRRISCLPVIRPDRTLVGILTSADVLRFARQHVKELDFREYAAEYGD